MPYPVYPMPDGGVLLDPLMAASNFLVGWYAVGLYLVALAGFMNAVVAIELSRRPTVAPDGTLIPPAFDPLKLPQVLVTNGVKVAVLFFFGTLAFVFPDDTRRWPWLLLYVAYVVFVLVSEGVQFRRRVELPRLAVPKVPTVQAAEPVP